MANFDLIVIGAGPGGYVAALKAAELGMNVAVVENIRAGGTCLNRGCVPTKTLLHSSRLYRDITCDEKSGITAEKVNINMEQIFAHKREVTDRLVSGIEGMFDASKITYLHGTGTITFPGTVKVGDEEYTADKIIIATGSVPSNPPVPGFELPGVLTSNELLEGSDHVYDSVVVIGAGVIGIEFATFYNDLGVEVHLIEGAKRVLPMLDKELGQGLGRILKDRGVDVLTDSMVDHVEQDGDKLRVFYNRKGTIESVTGEVVLASIGRKPYMDGVLADGIELEMDGKDIKVDENYETSMPGVYAIGDVSSRMKLAHVASAQGIACVQKMVGQDNTTDFSIVPSCIYSRPEIACVGMTDAEAKDAGIPAKAGKAILTANAKVVIIDGDRSIMKVVANADTHEVIGAQFMCENATDMISQIGEAMANHLTAEDLLKAMRPHPTYEEGLTAAIEDLVKKLNK